eukprot:gene26665-biopygen3936
MSSLYRELSYDRSISRVHGVQFSVLGEDDILARSVCEVKVPRTFDGNDPVPDGLFDPRMGVIDNRKLCVTCHQRNTFCPGHFGHITLAQPCFYVQFYDIVKKLMTCVCFRCSKLLVDADVPEVHTMLTKKTPVSNMRRWDTVTKLCARVKRCGASTKNGCGARKPDSVSRWDDMRLRMLWKPSPSTRETESRELILTAEDTLRILRRITDEDCAILGLDPRFARPERFICTHLPVPPPSVRPSVRHESGQRQEDDLTHKLADIVKVNNMILEKIAKGGSAETVEKNGFVLQYHVATLIDNNTSLYPAKDRSGRSLRSLSERLGHKEGRIRGNLMGKRVDFSARTVITPDPNLSIDELGVPKRIAMNLTFPEVVNQYNIEELKLLVEKGADQYPGAKHVRKADGVGGSGGRTIRLKEHPSLREVVANLDIGDVVERHLRNGDYVLFNRQPSLHKMSMMAHRVRVMPYNTFRLNVCVCACYNADFDGDEMNMHVPQSLQTHHELQALAAVPLHVLSPRYSKPIISIVQDVALGVYRITQKNIQIPERQLFNLVAPNPTADARTLPGRIQANGETMASGRELLSTVLPPTLNTYLINENKDVGDDNFIPEDDEIRIERGKIKSGVLNAAVFGRETTGIVHSVFNTEGPEAVTLMLNNTQKLICDWLVLSGFSVGISDLWIPEETRIAIRAELDSAKKNVRELLRNVHEGTFENVSTRSNADFLEESITVALKKGEETAGKLALSGTDPDTNSVLNMIASGSKGKQVNFTQMISCLGGQSMEGQRVPYGFEGRTLPHFTKYDDGPEARGFVEHSFIEGLTPHEFFFHSMAGRIGLIDTAVRTSDTGYIQRKLIKAMEDCKVHHDRTVRNANGHVVQFLYGEDGMNATSLEFHSLPYMTLASPADMRPEYLLATREEVLELDPLGSPPSSSTLARLVTHFKQLVDDRRFVIETLCHGRSEDVPITYPVNFSRIVEDSSALLGAKSATDELAGPDSILDTIDDLISAMVCMQEERHQDLFQRRWPPILLRSFLSPKVLMRRFHMTRSALARVSSEILREFRKAIATPGEMVGIVAAQSIGEPCTQLTLNSFHVAGQQAATAATSGVPRLRELLSMTKKIKTPTMALQLRPEHSASIERAKDVMSDIQTTLLKDVVRSSAIYFDPHDDERSVVLADHGLLAFHKKYCLLVNNDGGQSSPWLMRLELDRERMLECNVRMIDVEVALGNMYGENVSCILADDNARELVCRVRLSTSSGDEDLLTDVKALHQSMMEACVIKGVVGISKAVLAKPAQGLKRFDPLTDSFVKNDTWSILTAGSNLVEVLSNEMIDGRRARTNDVFEIMNVLGIEAARTALIEEIRNVLGDLPLNHRHLALLGDTMTNRGFFMSVDRHGINNRGELGPLAKCSFEQSEKMLINAGVFSEFDRMNGVSANTIVGQIAPCGTGDTQVFLDEERLRASNVLSNVHVVAHRIPPVTTVPPTVPTGRVAAPLLTVNAPPTAMEGIIITLDADNASGTVSGAAGADEHPQRMRKASTAMMLEQDSLDIE